MMRGGVKGVGMGRRGRRGGHIEGDEEEEEEDDTRKWPKRGPGFGEEGASMDHEEVEEEYSHRSSSGAPEQERGGKKVQGTEVQG